MHLQSSIGPHWQAPVMHVNERVNLLQRIAHLELYFTKTDNPTPSKKTLKTHSAILDFLGGDNIFDTRVQEFDNGQVVADHGPYQRREAAL